MTKYVPIGIYFAKKCHGIFIQKQNISVESGVYGTMLDIAQRLYGKEINTSEVMQSRYTLNSFRHTFFVARCQKASNNDSMFAGTLMFDINNMWRARGEDNLQPRSNKTCRYRYL